MRFHKLFITFMFFIVAGSGCATNQTRPCEWGEVAEALVGSHPDAEAAASELARLNGTPVGATHWTELCGRKECGGLARRYSTQFRRAAILAEAATQLDTLAAHVEASGRESYALVLAVNRFAALRKRIARAEMELADLPPLHEFSARERPTAEQGRIAAQEQLARAARTTAQLRSRLARLVAHGDENPALVDHGRAPMWQRLIDGDIGGNALDPVDPATVATSP